MNETEKEGDSQSADAARFPYYVGTIVHVNYAKGSGVLRTGNGREVKFVLPFVEILDGYKIRDLTDGMQVGFDLGWTSRGLRITKIKIF